MLEPVLQGVHVLDLSRDVSGAYATKVLADLGADVLKIEPPGRGDPVRWLPPFGADIAGVERSGFAAYLHGGKRSVTLDIDAASGRDLLVALARDAQVVIDTLEPEHRAAAGLERLRVDAANARLITVSVTPFGLSGPYANYAATDIVDFAMGGWMFGMGDPDKAPLNPGFHYARMVAGLYAASGILLALEWADTTGEGQDLEVAVMDAVISVLPYDIATFSYTGLLRHRAGAIYFGNPLAAIYPCKDGYVQFQNPGGPRWESLCAMIGNPGLAIDVRFASIEARAVHADALRAALGPWFMEHTRAEIFEEAGRRHLVFSLVPSMDELMELACFDMREYFVRVSHAVLGAVTMPGAPYRMSVTPWHAGPPPRLGEHNVAVYAEGLGLSAADLAAYAEQGII